MVSLRKVLAGDFACTVWPLAEHVCWTLSKRCMTYVGQNIRCRAVHILYLLLQYVGPKYSLRSLRYPIRWRLVSFLRIYVRRDGIGRNCPLWVWGACQAGIVPNGWVPANAMRTVSGSEYMPGAAIVFNDCDMMLNTAYGK